MRRAALGRAVAAVLVALVAGGCTSPSDAPDATAPASPPPATGPTGPPLRAIGFDQERISVALVVDISGPGRHRGARLVEGADAFWAGVAAEGGIGGQFPVELVVLDSQGDGEVARQALSDFANDVAAVALVDDVAVAEAIRPVLADQGMVAVSVEPSPDAYTDRHRLPVGLGDGLRIAALAQLLDTDDAAGAWCPVGEEGPSMTALVGALTGADPTATLADPVLVAADADLGAVTASLAGCGVVWLPSAGGGRDRLLVALAAAEHPGTVAVAVDEIVLPVGTTPWASGRLVLATNGPDWTEPSPLVDEMLAVVAAQSPDLTVTATTAVGWTAQDVVSQVLTRAFERGSFDRASLLEIATELPPPESIVPTWAIAPTGERLAAGSMVALTPGPEGALGAGGAEVVGVVDVGPTAAEQGVS